MDEVKQAPPVGVKDDEGKLEFTQVPYDALKEVIRVLMWGAYERLRKDGKRGYGSRNWENVENARTRYYNAAMRHLNQWYYGEERNDSGPNGSGRHHLAHMICCGFFLLSMDLRRMFQDDPFKEP